MYCKHCGQEVEDNASFCEHCGKALNQSADDSQTKKKKSKKPFYKRWWFWAIFIALLLGSCGSGEESDSGISTTPPTTTAATTVPAPSAEQVFIQEFCAGSGLAEETAKNVYDLFTEDLLFESITFIEQQESGFGAWDIEADGLKITVMADDDGIYTAFTKGSAITIYDGNTLLTKEAILSAIENTEPATVTTEEPVANTEATDADGISIDSALYLVESTLQDSFTNFDISYEDQIITIKIWEDGIATAAMLAAAGDEDFLKSWDQLVESQKELGSSIYEFVSALGISDTSVVVNVLNDLNTENVLLTTMNGVVLYDSVNGN